MKYIELYGLDIKNEVSKIKEELLADAKSIFVYSGKQPAYLYDYIEALCQVEDGLDDEDLFKLRICYERDDLNVSLAQGGLKWAGIKSAKSLIKKLDGQTKCKIFVEELEDDDNYKKVRGQLAFIVQQLIYIGYPLDLVDIMLRKEERDATITKRFMNHIDELATGCDSSLTMLSGFEQELANLQIDNAKVAKLKDKWLADLQDALAFQREIKKQVELAKQVELKLAIMASKKAGKSVIVDCIIGEEIAPTSTELATPNNCVYKKSEDNCYHLQVGDGARECFETCEKIKEEINRYFKEAQNDKEHSFALPDMNIEYVTDANNFSPYTIYDTAGPDAAGTDHDKVAENALQICDVAVFAIDYAKYLTCSEEEYLRHVKEEFEKKGKFHSLFFALNKIDTRYNDVESVKSLVKSVDFIRTRLANINEDYRDCIIFPTSSLEYFSTLEAEKVGIAELDGGGTVTSEELKRIKREHKDCKELQWLYNQSLNLEYYNGITEFSYDEFKKDSGMPALMGYLYYVATNKARVEIVNRIVSNISLQKQKLRHLCDELYDLLLAY